MPSSTSSSPILFPIVPGAHFGMVLGLGGLGSVWRVASRVWGYPTWIGEALLTLAAVVWLGWITLFAAKWIWARPAARAELDDPVPAFGLGLVAMGTLMSSIGWMIHAPAIAWCILVGGLVGGISLTAWLHGNLWQGGRGIETFTPLTILPAVGTAYTGALAAAAFGYTELAAVLWGPGLVTWVMMDSLVLLRLMSHPLPPPLRATIGIQFAPPTVGTLAYLGFTPGPPDKVVSILLGYGILQACVLLRLNGWLRTHPFSAGAWAFTFGVAAFAGSTLICLERQPNGLIGSLAWPAFVFANAFIGYVVVRTVALAFQGRLFPAWQGAR